MAISAAIALFLPIAAALWWSHKSGIGWRYWGFGALVFFVSQIVLRLPWLVPLGAAVSGSIKGNLWLTAAWVAFAAITAALFEEIGRWLGYRYLLREEKSFRSGMMYGLGHGGIESILLVGLSVAASLATYVLLAQGKLPQLPAEQAAQISAVLAAQTPLTALMGGVERIFTLVFHVAFSVLVLQCFLRGERRWLFYSIAAHFFINIVGPGLNGISIFVAEGALFVLALLAFMVIVRLKDTPATEPGAHPQGAA
jgi:uncharacterized membrane protein YhfC